MIDKDQMELTVTDDQLTVTVDGKQTDEENISYRIKQFDFSKFERTFTLPDNIDTDAITAKLDMGLLRILVPKMEAGTSSSSTKIQID